MFSVYICLVKMDKSNGRTANFTEENIKLLLKLVEENKNVIENKKTDNVTSKQKEDAWLRLSELFNRHSASQRTAKVLRTKYYNLKKNMKKRAAEEKRSSYATGGGPPMKEGMSQSDLKLKSILHDAQISGLDAVYDCDFINENSNTLQSISLTSEENAGKEDSFYADGEIEELDGPSCSWQKYNPGMLKKPINQKLNHQINPYSKPKKVTSWSKLADVKAKWCEEKAKREIELMEEEYKSRLAYWEEKKLLEKKEFELRMKMLQEKHEKEMDKENTVV